MSSIKVAVRCRPLFEQERPATGLDIQSRRILLDSKTYDPDYTFSPSANQDDLFQACSPILQCVKDGLNGTIMVYGQTGTGKTYTMLGKDQEDNGLVHKVIAHMLEHVQQKTMDGAQCALTLSMIEIYNEKLTDMLSETGDEEVTLIGGFPRFTNKVTLARLNDAKEAVTRGLAWRHTAATMMNERSSRSHVVFIVDLEECNAFTEQTDVAHLFLVDLAGSESLKKSQAVGSTANEAGKINKSLLALKGVFLALSNTNEATRPAHVPYRDSKLTELLQDSIGGTARTLMIACISAVGRDIEETKSTLMYAVKARSIRNAANTEKEKILIRLRSVEVENQKLRNRLQERVNERGGYYITKEEHDHYQEAELEAKELKESIEQLVKDRQNSDAKQHISESHTKILQGMVQDKEMELQQFKQLYQDALLRFEGQSLLLQRTVHTAVAEAKSAAQVSSQDRFDALDRWRTQVIKMVDGIARETTTPKCTMNGPDATTVPCMAPLPFSTQERSPSKNSIPATASIPSSPSRARGGRGAGGAGGRHGAPPAAHSAIATGGALQVVPVSIVQRTLELEDEAKESTDVSFDWFHALDADCARIVQRINDSFSVLLSEWTLSHDTYLEHIRSLEAKRKSNVRNLCAALRTQLEEGLQRIAKADDTGAEDIAREHIFYSDKVHTRAKGTPMPASAAALQQVVRNTCAGTLKSMAPHMPPPCVSTVLEDALENINATYKNKLFGAMAQSVLPLSSFESPRLSPTGPYSPKYTAPPSFSQETAQGSGTVPNANINNGNFSNNYNNGSVGAAAQGTLSGGRNKENLLHGALSTTMNGSGNMNATSNGSSAPMNSNSNSNNNKDSFRSRTSLSCRGSNVHRNSRPEKRNRSANSSQGEVKQRVRRQK